MTHRCASKLYMGYAFGERTKLGAMKHFAMVETCAEQFIDRKICPVQESLQY